jgi:transposase-like protein
MSTMRAYTREFRESAVGLVLSEGLSIRKAADDLGMPYHTLHGWVRAARRSRRKPVQKGSESHDASDRSWIYRRAMDRALDRMAELMKQAS